MKPYAMLAPAGQADKAKGERPMGSAFSRLPAHRAARSSFLTLWIRDEENRTMHPKRIGLMVAVLACSARWCADADESTVRQRIMFPDPRLAVHGLPWFNEDKPILRRLPLRLKDRFRPAVWDLAQDPSGGRIRFRTDSTRIGLIAENPYFSNMHHMASVGENGFDLYVGHDYQGSAWPDASGKITKEWRVGRERKMRDITLYLPLYKAVTIQEVNLDADAHLEAPTPYAIRKPIVYYGSSITQGGCASNPGRSCQAILERRLSADFVNLGFSGNGLGEPALAEAICWTDIIFVMEKKHVRMLREQFGQALDGKEIICLHIPDDYRYMEPALIDELKAKLNQYIQMPQ